MRPKNRPDPWAHITEKLQAEAREFNELRNQIGLEFRAVQQESMASWCDWMDEVDQQATPHSMAITVRLLNAADEVSDEVNMELQAAGEAGTSFPSLWPFPPSWFGPGTSLQFSQDYIGRWSVKKIGPTKLHLKIRRRSEGEPTTFVVDDDMKLLRGLQPNDIASIDVAVESGV